MPKTVVIVNPKSAGGATGKRWPELADKIGRVLPFDEAFTKAQGDATTLTRQALADGATRVVALGGDGTINEVVNGFFDQAGQPLAQAATASLGIIPLGTGGDFRRTLGIPTDISQAAAVVANGKASPVDVGRVSFVAPDGSPQTRMFINICSFGVSGEVDRIVNQSSKRLGKLGYFWASAKATLQYDNQRVAMVFDHNAAKPVEVTINTVAIANGRYFGGAMKVAPNASVDDGAFDVVCLGDLGFWDLLASGRRIYQGSHLAMAKVSARQATHVTAAPLDATQRVQIDLDGENVGQLPATFEMLAGAISLIRPTA